MVRPFDVIVIGGGAAGMLSAGVAASCGKRVLLLEPNRDLGRKLRITGKGRCNVCNNCPPEEVLQNVITGSRFLYSAVWGFPPEEVMAFFSGIGVPLKTERGNRVFPVSDRATDVRDALGNWMRTQGVTVLRDRALSLILREDRIAGVRGEKGSYAAPRVILATGGLSYPATGSTGDGYLMAEQAGHTVTPRSGSLVPLVTEEDCRSLSGLSLRNTALTLKGKGKKPLYRDFGELLFMDYGLSGPTVLSASCHVAEKQLPLALELDLKPALEEGKLDARLLRDFAARRNDPIESCLRALLPAQLIPVILERCGIPGNLPVHDVTRAQRTSIVNALKHLTFTITGKRPVEEAIVTRGGVKTAEVNPTTMASKLCPGLYFAGEILDCDAYTGGFNLQIAWSTAYAAGMACGEQENS